MSFDCCLKFYIANIRRKLFVVVVEFWESFARFIKWNLPYKSYKFFFFCKSIIINQLEQNNVFLGWLFVSFRRRRNPISCSRYVICFACSLSLGSWLKKSHPDLADWVDIFFNLNIPIAIRSDKKISAIRVIRGKKQTWNKKHLKQKHHVT